MGLALLASESAAVEQALAQIFGLQLLQVGSWGLPDQFLRYARTRRQSLLAAESGTGVAAISRPSRLSIESDSVDVVLLPHTLEIDPQPHQVLREADRVLVGEGHLIVLGFNPWSAWGLRHVVSRRRFPVGARRLIPEKRLSDWLSLLGMDVAESVHHLHAPPINRESLQRRLGSLEGVGRRVLSPLPGAYVLVAQKRVYSVTPVRPSWSRTRHRVAGGLVEPTTRSAA